MESGAFLKITAKIQDLGEVRRFVRDRLTAFGADPEAAYDIVVAVDEAVTNILRYGYQGAPGQIELEVLQQGDAVQIILRDEAPGFDPGQAPTPDTSLPLEKRPIGGLGIHLIRTIMDQVIHRERPNGGNELTLVKNGVIKN